MLSKVGVHCKHGGIQQVLATALTLMHTVCFDSLFYRLIRLLYSACTVCQVQNIRRSTWSQLGTLLQEAASPNLLIVTAQQQQQRLQHLQLQQQQQSSGHATQQQQAGSSVSGSQGDSADTQGFAAAAASGQPSKESQLSSRVSHMATYGALVGFLVADTLTTTQKAVWMVSSYPWCVISCGAWQQQHTLPWSAKAELDLVHGHQGCHNVGTARHACIEGRAQLFPRLFVIGLCCPVCWLQQDPGTSHPVQLCLTDAPAAGCS